MVSLSVGVIGARGKAEFISTTKVSIKPLTSLWGVVVLSQGSLLLYTPPVLFDATE